MKKKERYFINKLGGACFMLDKERFTNLVLKILKEGEGGTIVFVVSAIACVTRLLVNLYQAREQNHSKAEINKIIFKFEEIHLEMIERLIFKDSYLVKNDFSNLLNELILFANSQNIPSDKDHAHILCFGERCSSLIFHAFLSQQVNDCCLLDARKFIIGEGDSYLNANPIISQTIKGISDQFSDSDCAVFLTQGYIASDQCGIDMTLGFDGSDLTASLIAYALSKKGGPQIFLTYWKDKLGVLINPLNSDVDIYPILKNSEYLALSSVPVRYDAVELLSGKRGLISIRSFEYLEEMGTVIVP